MCDVGGLLHNSCTADTLEFKWGVTMDPFALYKSCMLCLVMDRQSFILFVDCVSGDGHI